MFINLGKSLNRKTSRIVVGEMSRRTCSNCGYIYYVNVHVDIEYACPQCGFVEDEKIIGQLKGRISVADE